MKQPPLTRAELEDLHSLLRRHCERMERRRDPDAERMAREVALLAVELEES